MPSKLKFQEAELGNRLDLEAALRNSHELLEKEEIKKELRELVARGQKGLAHHSETINPKKTEGNETTPAPEKLIYNDFYEETKDSLSLFSRSITKDPKLAGKLFFLGLFWCLVTLPVLGAVSLFHGIKTGAIWLYDLIVFSFNYFFASVLAVLAYGTQ